MFLNYYILNFLNILLLEKFNFKSSKYINKLFSIDFNIFFVTRNTLKNTNYNIINNFLIYSRLLEQLTSQRSYFNINSYRYNLSIEDLTSENFSNNYEIVYNLKVTLKNRELYYSLLLNCFYFSSIIKSLIFKVTDITPHRCFSYQLYIKLSNLIITETSYLKKLLNHRIYIKYNFFNSKFVNKYFLNLLTLIKSEKLNYKSLNNKNI